jgi:hypothetical protein
MDIDTRMMMMYDTSGEEPGDDLTASGSWLVIVRLSLRSQCAHFLCFPHAGEGGLR